MAQQTINVGTSPNDGTGTPLRTAFQYTNSNFTELYTAVGPSGNNIVVPGTATITGDLTVRTNKLAVTSTGVGIGTATPNAAYILDLTTANDARARQWIADSGFLGSGNLANGYQLRTLSGSTDGLKISNYANTVEYLRIDSSGNVGVGVTPSAWTSSYKALQIGTVGAISSGSSSAYGFTLSSNLYQGASGNQYITTGYAGRYDIRTDNGNHVWYTAASGSAGGVISLSTSMTLDASGNLLVGTTNSASNAGIGLKASYSATAPYYATVGSSNASNVYSYLLYSTTDAAFKFYVSYSGTVSATNGTISAISDQRLKENVQDIDVGLGAILALKPRKFDWKEGKGKNIKGDRGFIAQEFEQVFPNLVDEWKDNAPEGEAPYKSVRQDLIPVLVKAIQELTARVEALEA